MFPFQNGILDGYPLKQREEGIFSLWQKEIVLTTNTSYIVDSNWPVNPLGFDLHLLCNPENRPDVLQRRLRDQDLAAYGIGLDAGREVDMRPDRKSTRLNSSHRCISYAVFCLKKKRKVYS